ncbi:hypothetical protein LZY01_00330 [Levilactobacillus zymae]|uniref:Protein tyrosine phosphatase n=1 Tax=Levilactobacillus zymae TaxID=267363 RepID=A0ABQ0WSR2_9LACO|nr:tyrosine-protein phosphatase [Levilactobacillus zymae]KRL15676.1 protein tyrosine serine phosphatase [Levilactobacillus zymae DSM 19395]QFR60662.1 hypothetical protein LZ395_03575 [Levilactobacillus zymae]GEO70865.1 hypothetical protein LZY01_00330 [Levilactobacillus zymae]
MNHRLQRTLSVAMLTLTLTSAGMPIVSTLAATSQQPVEKNDTSASNKDSSKKQNSPSAKQPANNSGITDKKKAKPKVNPTLDPSVWAPLPDKLSDIGEITNDKDKVDGYGVSVLVIPTDGQPGARIKGTGLTNDRDLGGYVTANKKWKIRSNQLIRSESLDKLSDTGMQILLKDGLKHIIDLRTPGQINSRPDRKIAGVSWENLSVLGDTADNGFNTDANGMFPDNPTPAQGGGFYNHQVEFSKTSLDAYHTFLNRLLTNSGATLFHCSSGKDRTGIASFILMSALGIDPKTAAYDYMLSDSYWHHVDYSWIKEYYREIKEYYGDMQNYITKALDFSPKQQELLKSKYLVSNDGKNTAYPAPSTPNVVTPNTSVNVVPSEPKPANKVIESIKKPITENQSIGTSNKVNSSTVSQPTQKATKHKKARTKVKIISVKKIKRAQFVHLKGHRAYFYDMKLKHKVGQSGKTGFHPKAKWKLMKTAKIKVNGKVKTFYQIKSPRGHLRWIQKNFVKLIKA